MNVAIVRAETNEETTEEMLNIALEYVGEQDVEIVDVVTVPGVHELPVVTTTLLKQSIVDGVVVLGTIITGTTDHDQLLANNVSKQLLELASEYEKPVGYGVIGPNASWKEVRGRTEHYAKGAIDAVVDSHAAIDQIEREY